jgi:hypothetical protein
MAQTIPKSPEDLEQNGWDRFLGVIPKISYHEAIEN